MRNVDTRGQTEVLGFALVFAVVIVAVGLVAATGFAGLGDAQAVEATNNAVRAFEVLDDNVDDLVDGRSPHRGTEVKLSGSQLALGPAESVTVAGERVGDPSQNFTYTFDVRPIEYAVGDTTLVYANGAVVRQEPESAVMLRDPSLVFGADEVVVPIVQTRSLDTTGVGGDRTVNVRTSLAETTLLAAETDPYTVSYTVTSPRATTWERYFQGLDGATVTRTGDTVTATVTTDRVYVTVVRIDVALE